MKPVYGKRETVYANPHQKVHRVRATLGVTFKNLYVTDYGPRAALIVAGPDGILLTRQYRYLVDALSWEIPGGKADTGETPEVAAIRECLEETGVRCQGLAPLISFLPGLDTLDNPTHIFFTSAFETVVDRPPHAAEVKETHWMPLHRCLDMINAGKIVDSLSLIALLSYARQQDTA